MHVVRADGSETVMLMDFGIATLLAGGARLTAEGVVCGTPAYLAPETARGEDADHRADVYALATVAFELLTGALPFDAENQLRILPMKAFRDPPKLTLIAGRAFSEPIEDVIACGLSRDPEARYRSAGEFVNALAHAAQLPADARALSPGSAPSAPATKLTEPEAVPTIAARPRGPTASRELPLGASDEFALEEAIETGAAAQSSAPVTAAVTPHAAADALRPSLRSAIEQQATVPSLHPSQELPRSRKGLFAVIGGVLALTGLAAVIWSGGDAGDDPMPVVVPAQPEPAVAAVAPPTPPPAAPPIAAPPASDPAPASDPVPAPVPVPESAPASRKTRNTRPTAARPPATTPAAATSTPPATTPAPTAEELNRQAAQALLSGHVARAAELYEQATLRDPRNAAAFRGLGLVSERLGRKPVAIRAYQRALQLAPTGPQSDTVRDRLGKLQ
jgi:serine/threonine-protein kinase